MKTISKNWKKQATRTTWAACAATCVFGIQDARAQDARPAAETDTAPKLDEPVKTEADYRNWFDVSVGGNLVSGNRARFMQRHQVPHDVHGGVESFHYEQDIGKRGLLEIDGRGIFDNDDYALRLNLEHPDWGYVRAGYREYRTWYDGSGGFLPSTGAFLRLYDTEMAIDRGEAWFEGQLARPNQPKITFRYSHLFRDGQKDSTSWGETGRGTPTGQQRAIVPSFWGIDEERDIFQLDVEHNIAGTDVGVGLRYENSDQDNRRYERRRPFEPQDRSITHREGVETDLFNVHAYSYTPITETILFTTGYSYTTLDTDIFGSRIYGSDYDAIYDPLFARRQQRDEGFLNLSGGARLDQHVAHLNLMFTPWDHFTIVPSFRLEVQDQTGVAEFEETNFGAPPALAEIRDHLYNSRDRSFIDVSEGLELRYTGFTNWVFYTRGEWLQGEGDLTERETEAATGAVALARETDSTRFTQKYVAGVNWYPARRFNIAAQYYFKSRKNDYDQIADSAANPPPSADRYPAYIRDQDFDTHDVNFRVTVRPLRNVSFVSRYDFQVSTIHNRMDFLDGVEGAESVAHIFGQSVTWTPLSRLYLQGSINYVLDQTTTPATGILPDGTVQDSENDYINVTATAGYALTEKTDLQAQYFLYYANNWQDNSLVSVPYNADAEEHGVSATVIHKLSARQQLLVRYGYFTNSEQTYGGNTDYDAHMLYSSYRYRF
jgi:hypothetical protein